MPKSPANTKDQTAASAEATDAGSAPEAGGVAGSEPKSEANIHGGGCHCGKVRYEISADVTNAMSCNCSICMKSGSLLTFIVPDQFRLIKGADDLIDYAFNNHVIHHMICRDCGIKSFAKGTTPDGRGMVAVNVRCLDDIDLKALTIMEFNGRNL
jgi:hypothetical protein